MGRTILGVIGLLGVACATTGAGKATEGRLPGLDVVRAAVLAQPWGADAQQIPSTVIEVGELQAVPYQSFATAQLELNVYGDPAAPAAIELGLKTTQAGLEPSVQQLVAGLLPNAEDRARLLEVSLEQGRLEREGLVFEVTPRTATDAYGAWWVTVSAPDRLAASRASAAELAELVDTQAQAAPAYPRVRKGSGRIFVKSFLKTGGTYVRSHRRR